MKEKKFIVISGPKLTAFREQKGLTQKELGDKMDVSRATVVTWEGKDRLKLSEKQVNKLAELIECKVSDLTQIDMKGDDILDHPLVKSFVDQINLQKKMIELLEKENAQLRGGK